MLGKIRDVILILVAAMFLMAVTGQGDIALIHGFNGSKPVPFLADLSTRSQVNIPYEHHADYVRDRLECHHDDCGVV